MIWLRELVAEYGEDWDQIVKALGVPPSRARHHWIRDEGDSASLSIWTADELRQLQRLLNADVKPKEFRMWHSPKRDNTLFKTCWAAADDETLLKIVNEPTANAKAKWKHTSKTLGRSIVACKSRARLLHRSRRFEPASDDPVTRVTSETQRQLQSSASVDWSLVSQAMGLGIRECLELSQCDDGKASWHYDPDAFSQSMADRMAGFIKEHYPAPVSVSYRAVSNFM
ncbi:hypothetical protein GGI06_002121 [Coemansia sp. S85]|nr:hypothetical protein GGI06_002121 [Coemansia sp. S85]